MQQFCWYSTITVILPAAAVIPSAVEGSSTIVIPSTVDGSSTIVIPSTVDGSSTIVILSAAKDLLE